MLRREQDPPGAGGPGAPHTGRGGYAPRPPLPQGGHRVPLQICTHCKYTFFLVRAEDP